MNNTWNTMPLTFAQSNTLKKLEEIKNTEQLAKIMREVHMTIRESSKQGRLGAIVTFRTSAIKGLPREVLPIIVGTHLTDLGYKIGIKDKPKKNSTSIEIFWGLPLEEE